MDAECHLLSHRSLPGFSSRTPRLELLFRQSLLWLLQELASKELPQRLASPNGCSLQMSRDPVQGSCACTGAALGTCPGPDPVFHRLAVK